MKSLRLWKSLGACSLTLALLAFNVGALRAQAPCDQPCASCAPVACSTGCSSCCNWLHCPPAMHYCMVGPPCICFKCGCPKPSIGPCEMQHFGYYETCWRPWPYPRNLSHCGAPVGGLMPQPIAAIPGALPGDPAGVDQPGRLPERRPGL